MQYRVSLGQPSLWNVSSKYTGIIIPVSNPAYFLDFCGADRQRAFQPRWHLLARSHF